MRWPVVILAAVLLAAMGGGLLAWQLTRQPAKLPQASCGRVITNWLNVSTQVGADAGVLTCFIVAARGCKAASIGVTEMGVDAGTDYVFTVEPGGTSCRVTELSQDYSANFGGSTGPVIATSCLRRVVTGKGVMLRCAGQDLLIPAAVSPPRPYTATLPRASCGSVVTHQLARNTRILGAGRGALPCFGAAIRACRSASIEVVQMGASTRTDHVFTIEPDGTGCLVYQEAQDYSGNSGGSTGPITGTSCYRTTVDRNGVMLGCAGQDVLIPATVFGSRR
jgi:hypothetical protein